MSSFEHSHYMYLFALKGGGRKLTFGKDPKDALEVLALRLSDEEMAEVIAEDFLKIDQREMQAYVHLLR